jgi:hypothetical protein
VLIMELRRRIEGEPEGTMTPAGLPYSSATGGEVFSHRCGRWSTMLFIEYDVDAEGQIELVALINAVEEEGQDEDGSAWLAWRRSAFDDAGLGCVGLTLEELSLLEATGDPEQLRATVERIILADRARKERTPS